jgi:DNA-binding NarL/FixJ family response regulator
VRLRFLTRPFRDQELLDAIHQAIQRDRANQKHQAEIAEHRARYDLLTQREREVLGLVVSCLLNKKIAAKLGTSEFTVKIQRRGVMQKMRAPSPPLSLSGGMIGSGERISSFPSSATADFSENRQEHHGQERPNTDRRPIRFVAIPRKGGQ